MGYTLSWPLWLLISWLLFPTKTKAERGLTDSEIVLIVCGLVLALGAIGEYLEEHKKLPRLVKWPRLVFIVMVVIGLLGEFFGDAGVFVFSSKLQQIEGAEIQALDRLAKAARDNANEAIDKSSKAKEGADTAMGVAKAVKIESASLQRGLAATKKLAEEAKSQGPRWVILEENKADLRDKLRAFRGQSFIIVTCDLHLLNPELNSTVAEMSGILEAAEWVRSDLLQERGCSFGTSMMVFINPSASPKSRHAADLLASELYHILPGLPPVAAAPYTIGLPAGVKIGSLAFDTMTDNPRSVILAIMSHP
jgi:hypothetical protein